MPFLCWTGRPMRVYGDSRGEVEVVIPHIEVIKHNKDLKYKNKFTVNKHFSFVDQENASVKHLHC